MTKAQEAKIRQKMIADGFKPETIEYEIQTRKENEKLYKEYKKLVKENKLLSLIDERCDVIENERNYIVWEFYGKRKDYEFTYYKNTNTIKMRWCLSSSKEKEWSFDGKIITKMSQLAALK